MENWDARSELDDRLDAVFDALPIGPARLQASRGNTEMTKTTTVPASQEVHELSEKLSDAKRELSRSRAELNRTRARLRELEQLKSALPRAAHRRDVAAKILAGLVGRAAHEPRDDSSAVARSIELTCDLLEQLDDASNDTATKGDDSSATDGDTATDRDTATEGEAIEPG